MPRSLADPGYQYQPLSEERRERMSVLAKRRLGAPEGHSTVYGVDVPDEHAERIRAAAAKLAAKHGRVAAASFVEQQRKGGFTAEIDRPWSMQEEAALRRCHYQDMSDRGIATQLGRTRNAIIGKRHRLKLYRPPDGLYHVPLKEVGKMVSNHFRSMGDTSYVTTGLMLVAPMFINRATAHNIAAYTRVAVEFVHRTGHILHKHGIWKDFELVDKERYVRDQESDFVLLLDAMLVHGQLGLTRNSAGEERWFLPKNLKD